jgi:hypothetical protein
MFGCKSGKLCHHRMFRPRNRGGFGKEKLAALPLSARAAR